jgi:hypothetical protein
MKVEFDAALAWKLPAPLLAAVSRVMVPTGAEFLPTVKNHVARNASEAAAGVGLGDGTGVGDGDGDGVGVGVGCILLETEPHPARNSKSPVKRRKVAVRTKSSLEPQLSVKKGEHIDRLGEQLMEAGCPGKRFNRRSERTRERTLRRDAEKLPTC